MGAIQGQIKEQEVKCQEDFKCEIGEMPVFIKQLKEESERALFNSEIILGIREGIVSIDPVPEPNPVISKSTSQVGLKSQKRSSLSTIEDDVDEDGLL